MIECFLFSKRMFLRRRPTVVLFGKQFHTNSHLWNQQYPIHKQFENMDQFLEYFQSKMPVEQMPSMSNELQTISLSKPFNKKSDIVKIMIKGFEKKNEKWFQFSLLKNNHQMIHQNYPINDFIPQLVSQMPLFSQIQFYYHPQDFSQKLWQFTRKSKQSAIQWQEMIRTIKEDNMKQETTQVNRKKNYILDELDSNHRFLQEIQFMDPTNRTIFPSKFSKYKQMNRFLESVQDVLQDSDLHQQEFHVIDFACGKAYLSFALFDWLRSKSSSSTEVHLHGVDVKQDVVDWATTIAGKLEWNNNMHFSCSSIQDFQTPTANMVVALHACNTATDEVIKYAIMNQVKYCFVAPCCHKQVFPQIENDQMNSLLKHGKMKQEIASLVTDALRAKVLECFGYQVDVVEFVDSEHTAKNLMIRAVKKQQAEVSKQHWEEYTQFKQFWGIETFQLDSLFDSTTH